MPRNIRTRETQPTPLTEWVNTAIGNCPGKSLAQIAFEAEITLPYLTNVRYGDRVPSWGTVMRLAEVLGAKRKEAQEVLERTLQIRHARRRALKKWKEAEKEWTRAWRKMLVNYCPQLAKPEARADSVRKLVELWLRLTGTDRETMAKLVGNRPRFAPSAEAIGWLVLQVADKSACVRREVVKGLGEFDPDLDFAAARVVMVSAVKDRDAATKATAARVIRGLDKLQPDLSTALLEQMFVAASDKDAFDPEMAADFLRTKKPPLILTAARFQEQHDKSTG
jgi:hypothetical protein